MEGGNVDRVGDALLSSYKIRLEEFLSDRKEKKKKKKVRTWNKNTVKILFRKRQKLVLLEAE